MRRPCSPHRGGYNRGGSHVGGTVSVPSGRRDPFTSLTSGHGSRRRRTVQPFKDAAAFEHPLLCVGFLRGVVPCSPGAVGRTAMKCLSWLSGLSGLIAGLVIVANSGAQDRARKETPAPAAAAANDAHAADHAAIDAVNAEFTRAF